MRREGSYKTETVLVEPEVEALCLSRVVEVETVEERNRGVNATCDRLWLQRHGAVE